MSGETAPPGAGDGGGTGGPDAAERPRGGVPARRTVSGEELERVMRRAAELQLGRRTDEDLDEAEVLRIGEEVGLEPSHVRRALAELRADALVPARPADAGLGTGLWGGGWIRAGRVVPGEPQVVLRRLERWLEEEQSLRQLRDRPGYAAFEPAKDFVSVVRRAFDWKGRGYELAEARGLDVHAEGLEPGRTLVTLTADLRNRRAGHAAGWIAGLLVPGGAAAGLLAGPAGLPVVLALGAAGVGVLGGGVAGARWTYARKRARLKLALEGVLDWLERGAPRQEAPKLSERIGRFLKELDEL